ncbi:hypothetical protein CPB83DRAFT_856914 [Crepidotus variabilis]|uniref:Uncharacterized protein n=1 Tax=Crepidotus variabilis TaxID=179855 RepID=A0A9P6EDD7_9AGAR|nr:hypothetical protein CPB83DRAFT_856914 [Crepidotus variabilis]
MQSVVLLSLFFFTSGVLNAYRLLWRGINNTDLASINSQRVNIRPGPRRHGSSASSDPPSDSRSPTAVKET